LAPGLRRFTDRFDEREGWKVQYCSLASFLGVMLLALAYVLLAWAQSWSVDVDLTCTVHVCLSTVRSKSNSIKKPMAINEKK